jgi:hypothetical protein
MGVIWRNDSKYCGTCVFWAGNRSFDLLPSVNVDPTGYGACTNIRSHFCQIKQSKMASENGCEHYELHPSLR